MLSKYLTRKNKQQLTVKKMDNEKLIKLVYERNELWDVRNKNYHNRDFSRKLWNEIANLMDCSNHLAKSKWQNLRDTYRKEYMKQIASPDLKDNGPHWKYFNKLSFLNEVLALRKKPIPTVGTRSSRSSNKNRVKNLLTIAEDSRETGDVNDDLEYTDINPLRYLCEVPQVVADEMDDTTMEQDTTSEDVIVTNENQDNNNNGPRKSKISTKRMKTEHYSIHPSPNLQEDENENQRQHFYHEEYHNFEINPNQGQKNLVLYADSEVIGTENILPKNMVHDEDYHFLMSLLPHLADIPKDRKLHIRQKLQQVLIDEQQSEKNTTVTKLNNNEQVVDELQITTKFVTTDNEIDQVQPSIVKTEIIE